MQEHAELDKAHLGALFAREDYPALREQLRRHARRPGWALALFWWINGPREGSPRLRLIDPVYTRYCIRVTRAVVDWAPAAGVTGDDAVALLVDLARRGSPRPGEVRRLVRKFGLTAAALGRPGPFWRESQAWAHLQAVCRKYRQAHVLCELALEFGMPALAGREVLPALRQGHLAVAQECVGAFALRVATGPAERGYPEAAATLCVAALRGHGPVVDWLRRQGVPADFAAVQAWRGERPEDADDDHAPPPWADFASPAAVARAVELFGPPLLGEVLRAVEDEKGEPAARALQSALQSAPGAAAGERAPRA